MRTLRVDEPTAIGNYRLAGVLGAGGMGQVFLGIARDGRLAAIKQVLPSVADEPDFRVRFAREVDASRRVSGAYTAAVLDADPSAPTPWLASVFVPGPSLDAAVQAHGPLPVGSMRLLTVGLAVALQDIHRAGLVHRDLKPSNVLLTEEGPRVIDFGIAQAATSSGNRLTETGAVVGSPGFMSPEQVDGRSVTPASDVFTLGSVLTYAMTGVGPFGDAPTHVLLYRIAYTQPDLSRVPPQLRGPIQACLAKDPGRRPTLDQILQAAGPVPPGVAWLPPPVLQMIHARSDAARRLAGAGPPIPHPGPATQAPPPVPPRRRGPGISRRAGVLASAGVLTLVVALAATLVFVLRSGEASPREAAALVTAIAPTAENPPEGFVVGDDRTTPELDGRPADDPLRFDRSGTAFACVAFDPPTPSEAGIVALTKPNYQTFGPEEAARLGRLPDQLLFSVAYLDSELRTTIMSEIRTRIAECVNDGTRLDGAARDFRISGAPPIPGADTTVGFTATSDPETEFAAPPQVIDCEFSRVDAIVMRVCALITNDSGSVQGRDEQVRRLARATLVSLVERARSEQGLS